jgi:hypothetical protein
MHIELSQDEALALRDLLRSKVKELDKEINRIDSLRYKSELRNIEHQLERVLGAIDSEGKATAPDWEPRDQVVDTDRSSR